MKENLELVKRARAALGPDGEIMLDCWMAWTERYTIEMAEMMAPYRIYWMEEVLQPHDYAGFGRLNTTVKSTRIATGEHEYGRYGFRYLLEMTKDQRRAARTRQAEQRRAGAGRIQGCE